MAGLGERNLHGLEHAIVVHREGHLNLEGPGRVDTLGSWPILRVTPVATTNPAVPAPVARVLTALVVVQVQARGPRVLVCVLQADLSAGCVAGRVAVPAEVVVACTSAALLAHGDEVELSVAPTANSGQVRGVPDRTPQKLDGCVLAVVVLARGAIRREICPALEVRHDRPVRVGHVHYRSPLLGCVPLSTHYGHHALASHVQLAWARFVRKDATLIQGAIAHLLGQHVSNNAVLRQPVSQQARNHAGPLDPLRFLPVPQFLEVAMVG
mmetsp:Transcript_83384/g.269747  ORF Transcript_83384/g.269747 Transcript_83384/m.269747 type:complete len:268 (+) Transcript_83384:1403-2206(+)